MGLFLRNMIVVIGFVIITVSCGGKQDNRIVLSSESEDHLTIPRGDDAGKTINRQKLAVLIADHFDDISRVYNISFESELYFSEAVWNTLSLGLNDALDHTDYFTTSFTVETTSNTIHGNIQCLSRSTSDDKLYMTDCKNDHVVLDKNIEIPFHKISVTRQNREPLQ